MSIWSFLPERLKHNFVIPNMSSIHSIVVKVNDTRSIHRVFVSRYDIQIVLTFFLFFLETSYFVDLLVDKHTFKPDLILSWLTHRQIYILTWPNNHLQIETTCLSTFRRSYVTFCNVSYLWARVNKDNNFGVLRVVNKFVCIYKKVFS